MLPEHQDKNKFEQEHPDVYKLIPTVGLCDKALAHTRDPIIETGKSSFITSSYDVRYVQVASEDH